jgi:ribosomal RNA assembly protein
MNQIKIPQDRIAVLIGKDGETKDLIENSTSSRLDIDSTEGDVSVFSEDPIKLFTCIEVIKAIGRGFNPELALMLIKLDYVLDVISIGEYTRSNNDFTRLRGRVIGKEGKSRRVMEDLLEVNICVYGKTVSIIGRGDSVALARRAIDSLLNGSTHATVYKWLEKQRSIFKKREIVEEPGF